MIKQRNDMLSKDEEIAFGVQIQAMKELKEKMETGYKALSAEERRVIIDGEKAFEILVGNYYNLARDIAHKHHRRTGTRYEIEDLLQDAIGALCEAAYAFDPSMDCKLSTYAFYGITKRVSTTINYQRIVRMPENKMLEYSKILKAQQEYAQLEEEDAVGDMSELDYVYENVGDLKKTEVDLILTNMQPQVSLNANINESGGELIDLFEAEAIDSTPTDLSGLDEEVVKVLSKMSSLEIELLSYEYSAIPVKIPYEEFLIKHNLNDRKAKTQIRRAVRKMRAIGEKMNA